MKQKYSLNNNWEFKISDYSVEGSAIPADLSDKWFPASVPGTIHTDLFNLGLIEDPYNEKNEYKTEWITRSSCIYKAEFDYPDAQIKNKNIKLVFEGIDTAAEVYLNSKLLGKTDNMFLKYEFNVGALLIPEKNLLEIRLTSPVVFSQKAERKYGRLYAALTSYRVYIRKAQYSFGWDWGPSYPTMGIWRPVYLIAEDSAVIRSVQFNTDRISTKGAALRIGINVSVKTREDLKAVVTLKHEDQQITKEVRLVKSDNYTVRLILPDPKLWWPNGEGEQNLYDLSIRIMDKPGNILDEINKNVGIRTLELKLKERRKETFRFVINGRLIYAKGMNWIPGDAFLPRVDKEKYRRLLTYAASANANIIRVWGGGIYEDDEFYNLCDELGLLVWQDFMFACAAYPEQRKFLKSVSKEITQNVERLRDHPCIAIWCGNNENEWIWQQSTKSSFKKMPGYKIFHKLMPKLMDTLDPSRPYWPTSPFSFDDDPNSQTSGNRHQWNIWSNWIDYSQAANDNSLFVTEFGFQGPANIDTFNKYIPEEKRKIQGAAFEYYNKQIEGPERIIRFMAGHLPICLEWEDFIYLGQLNQGLALKNCIGHWRTNGGVTNGSIIWQLNDTWPVTSWSLIDSELTPKMAYYFVRNVFSENLTWFVKTEDRLNVNILKQSSNEAAKLKTIVIDLVNGQFLFESLKDIKFSKGIYSTMETLSTIEFPEHKNWIVVATLYDRNENILYRNYYMEKEWKHIELPDPGLSFNLSRTSGSAVLTVSAKMPAFFIDAYYPGAHFSDRGFILLPGEEKRLNVIARNAVNIQEDKIRIFCLNDYLNGK